MCGSPNIEPRPFELVIPFPLVISLPNPFELAPPDPLTTSVWVAICVVVDWVVVVVDWVVIGAGADVDKITSGVVDGVGWGVKSIGVPG